MQSNSEIMDQDQQANLGITVVGASGDLATEKIFPALFALFCQGYLPENFHVVGFARSELTGDQFRSRIVEHLTCRYVPGESCEQRMEEFLERCRYVSGAYDSRDSFLDLYETMRSAESAQPTNRLYYLAIPPSLFIDVARAIGDAGLVSCGPDEPWSRVVIEKPFGRDRQSSDELTQGNFAGLHRESDLSDRPLSGQKKSFRTCWCCGLPTWFSSRFGTGDSSSPSASTGKRISARKAAAAISTGTGLSAM